MDTGGAAPSRKMSAVQQMFSNAQGLSAYARAWRKFKKPAAGQAVQRGARRAAGGRVQRKDGLEEHLCTLDFLF